MSGRKFVVILAFVAASYAAQARDFLEFDEAPTLHTLARAETVAVRLVDEREQECRQRLDKAGRGAADRFRRGGLEVVKREFSPDLEMVIRARGTRDGQSGCTVELNLSLHINAVHQMNRAAEGRGAASAILGTSVGESRGAMTRIDAWIRSQSEIFAGAIVYAWHEAKRLVGISSVYWRVTGLSHDVVTSRDALRRHIELCDGGHRFSTVRNGVRFGHAIFITCMQDLGYEIRHDSSVATVDCQWLERTNAGRGVGYRGELRCESPPSDSFQFGSLAAGRDRREPDQPD